MQLEIHHTTRYRFAAPVTFALQQVRKTPKSTPHQSVLDWSTEVTGGTKQLRFEDHHNNVVELISFDRNTTEISVVSPCTLRAVSRTPAPGCVRGVWVR